MRIHGGTVGVAALLLALTLTACGEGEPSSTPQQSQGGQSSQDDATGDPAQEGEGGEDPSALTVGELVYNDGGTGNPSSLGDYLLVTHEVATSYGIPCSSVSGMPMSPTASTGAAYALEETLEQYAAGGEHCADLAEGHDDGFGLALDGVLKFAHTSNNRTDPLERCPLPGECGRVAGGWYASVSAKPEKMADAGAQQRLELQALLRAYMDAAMVTW